eukprot:1483495-Amphidinium_carterae.1
MTLEMQNEINEKESDIYEDNKDAKQDYRKCTTLHHSIRTQAATPRTMGEDYETYYTGTEDTTFPSSSTNIRRTGNATRINAMTLQELKAQ